MLINAVNIRKLGNSPTTSQQHKIQRNTNATQIAFTLEKETVLVSATVLNREKKIPPAKWKVIVLIDLIVPKMEDHDMLIAVQMDMNKLECAMELCVCCRQTTRLELLPCNNPTCYARGGRCYDVKEKCAEGHKQDGLCTKFSACCVRE